MRKTLTKCRRIASQDEILPRIFRANGLVTGEIKRLLKTFLKGRGASTTALVRLACH